MARRLTFALLLAMATQALTGLLFPGTYRDVEWIRATWYGNDWVTLVVAVPLLAFGLIRMSRWSARGLLLWLGLVAYALYNYSFYLFGAALNAFFPIYVVAVVLAAVVLILALTDTDPRQVADRFRSAMPVRLIGGVLLFVGIGLSAVWLAMWAAFVFAGRPTPVEPEAFKLVAALDLSMMVPALIAGGVLLWKRKPWGFVIATIASIQAAFYLLVLSVNTVVLVQRGIARAPGELPIWGPLTLLTATVAFVLLANIRSNTRDPDAVHSQRRLGSLHGPRNRAAHG